MNEKLKIQELENARQAEVINILEKALVTSERKYQQEVQETDKAQNSTIEERVSLLELQVVDLEENMMDLDEDVDFLFDEQVIQDERLLGLEQTTDAINAELVSVDDEIEGLKVADITYHARISAVEENVDELQNDTIAFHSVLTSYSTISTQSTLIFNEVILNKGDAYDSTSGVFTAPSGGDGVYYFSTFVFGDDGEWGRFDMRLNDGVICTANPDHSNGGLDFASGSCTAVVSLVAGDEVRVVLGGSTDDTPLNDNASYLLNGFTGFKI